MRRIKGIRVFIGVKGTVGLEQRGGVRGVW
jgi:hypothetical protein